MQKIEPFKTMKTILISHFEFLSNCRFLKKVVPHTTVLHKQENINVATNGAYDYIALTRRIGNRLNDKLQTLKANIAQFHIFLHPKGQISITSLRIVCLRNFNHLYKWENVYYNNIPKPQFWLCAQKSLILSRYS